MPDAVVVELVPHWPVVRCDGCRRWFEVHGAPRRCPTCDGRLFTTLMDNLPVAMDEG